MAEYGEGERESELQYDEGGDGVIGPLLLLEDSWKERESKLNLYSNSPSELGTDDSREEAGEPALRLRAAAERADPFALFATFLFFDGGEYAAWHSASQSCAFSHSLMAISSSSSRIPLSMYLATTLKRRSSCAVCAVVGSLPSVAGRGGGLRYSVRLKDGRHKDTGRLIVCQD